MFFQKDGWRLPSLRPEVLFCSCATVAVVGSADSSKTEVLVEAQHAYFPNAASVGMTRPKSQLSTLVASHTLLGNDQLAENIERRTKVNNSFFDNTVAFVNPREVSVSSALRTLGVSTEKASVYGQTMELRLIRRAVGFFCLCRALFNKESFIPLSRWFFRSIQLRRVGRLPHQARPSTGVLACIISVLEHAGSARILVTGVNLNPESGYRLFRRTEANRGHLIPDLVIMRKLLKSGRLEWTEYQSHMGKTP